jgi:uncharacterized protein YgbK (DUF1537 family)
MPRALVVADDLTGATDTALAFAKRGYETNVQVDFNRTPPETTVLAVNTDSRYDDPEAARKRVHQVISESDAPIVYKKVDSTLRGNVVPEIQGALDCGFDFGLVAPASPALGRLTAGGYHLVDGRLLTDTEYVDDPNGPESAHLSTLIEGIDTTHLGIETVAAGSGAVRRAITDAPSGTIFTCDTTHDRHLESIARAADGIVDRALFVGSAGLAKHVSVLAEPDSEPNRIATEGSALGIVGSVSEQSLKQLAALPNEWVIALDPEVLLADPELAGSEAGERAAERLVSGENAVVTAAPDHTAIECTLAAGREAGLDEETIRRRVARSLASAAKAGIEEAAGLFVTGGDVAMVVFDRLNVGWLSLSGEEIEAGVPVSTLQEGAADGTTVVTKAGGFGREATVINCLGYLGGDNE